MDEVAAGFEGGATGSFLKEVFGKGTLGCEQGIELRRVAVETRLLTFFAITVPLGKRNLWKSFTPSPSTTPLR